MQISRAWKCQVNIIQLRAASWFGRPSIMWCATYFFRVACIAFLRRTRARPGVSSIELDAGFIDWTSFDLLKKSVRSAKKCPHLFPTTSLPLGASHQCHAGGR